MEFKGTKGRWEIEGHPYFDEEDGYVGAYNITTQNREQTVTAIPAYEFWGQTIETAKANALLISKAPEMLEMLEKAMIELSRIKLSMLAHPDCTVGSEFDDYTTSAQECEDEIEQLIKEATTL